MSRKQFNLLTVLILAVSFLGGAVAIRLFSPGEAWAQGGPETIDVSVSGLPGLRMVSIPGGSFMMGSVDGENSEQPVHMVTLSAFQMSVTEITQAQYEAVMGNNPSYFKGDNLPVEQVGWNDAVEFCRKLSELTGNSFELPTEAEWEYACRAGTTTRFYTGEKENALGRAGWYSANSGKKTHPVGQKQPNALGLYDMHGNVLEWCKDWYSSRYYSQSENATDPQGPAPGSNRVNRGGSWYGHANFCRSANRVNFHPDFRHDYVGFRVVRR